MASSSLIAELREIERSNLHTCVSQGDFVFVYLMLSMREGGLRGVRAYSVVTHTEEISSSGREFKGRKREG